MSYYTVIDRCPQCNEVQKRWVISLQEEEDVIKCPHCMSNYSKDSGIVEIVLSDNSFSWSNTASS